MYFFHLLLNPLLGWHPPQIFCLYFWLACKPVGLDQLLCLDLKRAKCRHQKLLYINSVHNQKMHQHIPRFHRNLCIDCFQTKPPSFYHLHKNGYHSRSIHQGIRNQRRVRCDRLVAKVLPQSSLRVYPCWQHLSELELLLKHYQLSYCLQYFYP